MAARELRFQSGIFTVSIQQSELAALSRISEAEFEGPVRRSSEGLVYRICTRAPIRSGDLRAGLIVAPGREKSSVYGKIVNDIVFDSAMNDTFVKMSKAGRRYYYPASQEYGFKTRRGRKVPGLYYMRDTAAIYYTEHETAIVDDTMNILEGL